MKAQLRFPIVALVTDRQAIGGAEELVEAVEQALAGGVNLVQLREKDLSQTELLELARTLRGLTKGRALLFVNGDANVALLSGAEGVHLSEAQSGSVRQASMQGLVACSVHDEEAAKRAARFGADLLVAGAVYHTQTHPGQTPSGPELIQRVAAAVDVPLLGIGGITTATAREVIAAGASGVAVIREVLAAPDVTAAAMRLREAVESAWAKRSAPLTKEAGQR